jgi:hypothetical protein
MKFTIALLWDSAKETPKMGCDQAKKLDLSAFYEYMHKSERKNIFRIVQNVQQVLLFTPAMFCVYVDHC